MLEANKEASAVSWAKNWRQWRKKEREKETTIGSLTLPLLSLLLGFTYLALDLEMQPTLNPYSVIKPPESSRNPKTINLNPLSYADN